MQMVKLEPYWAANRIQEGERAIARLSAVEKILKKILTAHEMSCVDWPAMREAKKLLNT